MNVISLQKLKSFWEKHKDAELPLRAWYGTCRKSRWKNLDDVHKVYPHADLVCDCTIFNVGGNKYRLIVKIRYKSQRIYVIHVMTHKEYDKKKWKNDC